MGTTGKKMLDETQYFKSKWKEWPTKETRKKQ